uniref:Uncharacterized protein n=1 Tax=Rhipicephalus zambeziensis TaxID=60191 RepID=A0A224YHZ8_9ACAR
MRTRGGRLVRGYVQKWRRSHCFITPHDLSCFLKLLRKDTTPSSLNRWSVKTMFLRAFYARTLSVLKTETIELRCSLASNPNPHVTFSTESRDVTSKWLVTHRHRFTRTVRIHL